MKFKLNLNEPGTRILGIASVLLVPIPIFVLALSFLLSASGIGSGMLNDLVKLSFGAGVLLLAILSVLVVVELIQDLYLDKVYQRNRNTKIKISAGYFECQYCGNRLVKQDDQNCSVCGKTLQ